MARKKVVEPEEVVDVTAVVPEIEEAGETQEFIWVDSVGAGGKAMVQIPKEG